jgi:selenocysteine lyase/cysteine desulfurase
MSLICKLFIYMKSSIINTPFDNIYFVNADMTASGSISNKIEKWLINNVYPYYGNIHSNTFNGKYMTHLLNESKSIIKKSINANENDILLMTGNGTTGAINHLIHILNLTDITYNKKKIVIFVSMIEHHSNYLPWVNLLNCNNDIKIIIIPIIDNIIDVNFIKENIIKYINYDIKIISISACSNISGVVQPIDIIS